MKLIDLKAGDTILVDNGFTCMDAGMKVIIEDNGRLCISCEEGFHFLDGQENSDGELVGIYSLKNIKIVVLYSAVSDNQDGSYTTYLFDREIDANQFLVNQLNKCGQACMDSIREHVLYFREDGVLLNPDVVNF